MTAKDYVILALIALLILGVVFGIIMPNSCGFGGSEGNPVDIVGLPPDTIHVHHYNTITVEKDKIIPVVDTVFVSLPDSSLVLGYVAQMDTTVVMDNAQIKTKVSFHHPQQLFDFVQTATVRADTTYVINTKLITQTQCKHKWSYTVIGILAGAVTGITGGLLLAQ